MQALFLYRFVPKGRTLESSKTTENFAWPGNRLQLSYRILFQDDFTFFFLFFFKRLLGTYKFNSKLTCNFPFFLLRNKKKSKLTVSFFMESIELLSNLHKQKKKIEKENCPPKNFSRHMVNTEISALTVCKIITILPRIKSRH